MDTKGSASGVLGVLKNKLAQSKADADRYQEECEDLRAKLKEENVKVNEAEQETRSLESRIRLLEDSLRYIILNI